MSDESQSEVELIECKGEDCGKMVSEDKTPCITCSEVFCDDCMTIWGDCVNCDTSDECNTCHDKGVETACENLRGNVL